MKMLPKAKIACMLIVDYADTRFCTLKSNIFAKTKKFAKPFLPIHLGPRQSLLNKKIEVKIT